MKELPIFGKGIYADSAFITRQRRLNCFYDVRTDQDKHSTVVRHTPGSLGALTLATNPIRGFKVVTGVLYVIAGNKLYAVSMGLSATVLGTLNTSAGVVSITDNAVQLGIFDGTNAYCYTIVSGSYAQSGANAAGAFVVITDGNCPQTATSCCYLSQRVIANALNSRQFFCSEQNDLTGWTNAESLPTFGTKGDFSDNIAAVDALNGNLILWGAGQSIEFWQDVGTSPLPFAKIAGVTQTVSLAAVNSRALFNNTLAFVGRAKEGGTQIYMLNGYTPEKISYSDVDDLLSSFGTTADGIALVYMSHGHPRYQVTFPGANRTLVFDALTKFWDEAQTGLSLIARHFGNLSVAFNGKNYASDSTTGILYQLSDTTYSDNGTSIKRQLVTRHVHAQGNELAVDELFLDMATGVGLQGNPVPTGQNYLSLDGASGDYASTPDSAALDITGDIQFILYAAANDWTPSATQVLISKADTVGNQRSYRIEITTAGLLRIINSPDGTTVVTSGVSTIAVPTVDGGGIWLKGTLQVSDGAGNRVCNFYYSNDSSSTVVGAVSWTQLGATVTTAGTTSLFSGSANLEVGAQTNGTLMNFNGQIYSAYVYNGIGGTLAASMVANDDVSKANSWTSVSGETWAANGTASIQGNYLPAVQGSDPQIMLQVSRNNGNTFGKEKWKSIGKAGKYFTRVRWTRLGSAKDFVFQLTMTDPVPFEIIHGAAVTDSPEATYG